MRVVQFKILTKVLELAPVPAYVHGFEKNKSIPVMARAHVGKDVVISLDIKDFFPSIKQFMVQAMFQQLGIDKKSSGILSELTTYKSYVPQGSLTAPKISNLIAAGTFGKEVEAYCKEQGLSLTIYADDITVSYSEPKDVNREEAKLKATGIIQAITRTVSKYGFTINLEKTKVMRRNSRQWVCGAVVNDKVNMKRQERYQLRAIVHNVAKNGIENEARKSGMDPEAFIRKYAGRINWMCQLNTDAGVKLKVAFRKVTLPYLKHHPEMEIEELSWNSGIEMPYVPTEEDEMIFSSKPDKALTADSPF